MENTHTPSPPDTMARNATRAEALLKSLANANRLQILCALVAGEKTAGTLGSCVDLSQSALSQHLAKLREAGIVSADKRGTHVYYRICNLEAQAVLSTLYLIYCHTSENTHIKAPS